MINYLNNADALDRGEATLRAMRWELYNYQQIYHQQNPTITFDLVAAWDTWFQNLMQQQFSLVQSWLQTWIAQGTTFWTANGATTAEGQYILDTLARYESRARVLGGWNAMGYPSGTPTSYLSDTNFPVPNPPLPSP